MFLEEIINDIQLESSRLECKAKLNRDDIVGWLKTIAGFANANGGVFYIGVEDKTNKLIGFDRKEVDNERNYFNNQVNEHITPRPSMNISFIRYLVKEKERFVIKITVKESLVKPVILKYKNIPSIFMRREGFTNGATYEEIIDMSIKSKNVQYDSLTSDIKYDASNYSKLREFYSEHNNGKELSDKALKSMGFYDEGGFLANGAVLFADDYKGDKTLVQCSVFSGMNKGSDRVVTINKFNGNLIDTIGYIVEFVEQRMNHTIIKLNDSRMNIDAYPRRALFEAVINAIAHRDYFLDGSQIQIDMFKNRLEISSPGGFYRGEKLDKTYDLSKIISKRRNELISSVLVSCNVMEAAGTGFDKIIEEYKIADETHKPYIYSTSDHFTLVLADLSYSEGIENGLLPTVNFMPPVNTTDHDAKILSYCYYQAHNTSEIAKHLKISNSTYFRNNIINNLVKQNYLITSKIGRSNYYKTNNELVNVD